MMLLIIIAVVSWISLIALSFYDKDEPTLYKEPEEECLFMNKLTAELRVVKSEDLPLPADFYREWELIDTWKI